MKVIEVNDKKTWKLFHKVPHLIYKNDPLWIAPLEKDIQKIFTPSQNSAFKTGEAKCMVLLNEKGNGIGRITAFIDHKRNKKNEHLHGAIGFFECINDQKAADTIYQAAADYLSQKGIKIIDGPINFGERDKFWGLLVKGRFEPMYNENYHPEYYKAFFDNWGFRPYEQVLSLRGKISEVPIAEFREKAKLSREKHGLHAELINPKNLKKYAIDFCEVYNAAFAKFPYFKALNVDMVLPLFKQMKPVLDPKVVCFAYQGDRPVGFCLLMPEINQFFKGTKGRLNLFTIPGFLFRKYKPRKKLLKGVAFGIHPDFQGKGVIGLMSDIIYDHCNTYYSDVLMATIRGLNERMVKAVAHFNVKIDREHIAYRKILDDSIAFEPLEFSKVLEKQDE